METVSPKPSTEETAVEEPGHTTLPSPGPTCPGGGRGEFKSSLQNACLRKTASLHLFPCCGKATRTGLDPKRGQLQNPEILQPERRPPPSTLPAPAPTPPHIRLQLCGNVPGPGAAARTLLAPMEEALCCGPESFLKVHAGSLGCCQPCTLPLARFLALFGQNRAKALFPYFPPICSVLFPCGPLSSHTYK